MIKDYFQLAMKNLGKRKLRSWLTMIGIFIGIAAVVSLIGLGEGLRNAITSQFGELGTDKLTIQAGGVQYGPPGSGVVNPLKISDLDKIKSLPGIKTAVSRLIRTGKIEFNKRQEMVYIASMPDGADRKLIEETINLDIDSGRLLKDGDKYKVVVGGNYKKDDAFGKAVKVGDRVKIQDTEVQVVGVLKKKGSFILDGAILMNEDVMRDIYNDKEKVDIIAVQVQSGYSMNLAKENIEKLLRKEREVKAGEEDFSVETPEQALSSVNAALFAVQLFVYIIAGISLLVGGIGITNTMYTAVIERTKEIGVMKSIGAQNKDIFLIFFVESGLLGLVGGIIGAALGVMLAYGFAFVGGMFLSPDLIKAKISLGLFFGALAFSFILGSIAGISPALRASKLQPVDALRYSK